MKRARAPSKRDMLRLDPSTLPDPYKPQKWDAYGSAPGKHEFIVADVFVSNAALYQSIYVHSGETRAIPADELALVLATLGLQPTGRMTDEPLPVGPRIEPGEAFHACVEPHALDVAVLACPSMTDVARDDVAVALHDALNGPDARVAMRLHEPDVASEPPGPIIIGLITEAIRLIELAEAVHDSNWKDPQHAVEALHDARRLLNKAIEPAE